MKLRSLLPAIGALLLSGSLVAGARQLGPASYTAAQADAGQTVYRAECARCHGVTLHGGVEEPPLAGGQFVAKWRDRTTHDLLNFIQTRMPPQSPGSLGDEVNLQILAHILRSNGATAGADPLITTTAVTIGSIVPEDSPPSAQK